MTVPSENPPGPPVGGEQPQDIAMRVEEMPPSDAAGILAGLTRQQAGAVAEILDPTTAGRIIAEMDNVQAALVIASMNAPEASMVLQEIPPDDRVDILYHITGPLHEQLIGEMDAPEADETRRLEKYPPDSAGGIMTTQVTALFEYITVGDAITLLRRLNEELEQMFYVYVIDTRGRLVGVLSMRDLILARPSTPLRDIMIKSVRSVPATMPQDEVTQLMRKFGYLDMPVVDESSKLVGLITLDDVVHRIQEEATGDVQRMFGAGAEERLNSPWFFSFRKRVWWLVINLATAFMAAAVVGLFEDTITRLAILAAYMPIVAGMGGNASAQAMAVAVRGLSLGKVDRALMKHVLLSQFFVGVLTGVIIGVLTMTIAIIFGQEDTTWTQNIALGAVVFIALVFNHTLACTTGAGIPFVLKRLGFDPAQSATIFATTVTDIAGFFALLGLARLFLPLLTGK